MAPQPRAAQFSAQLKFLQTALDDGAGERMQQFFPEGEFFTHVLTGLAQAHDPATLPHAREQLAVIARSVEGALQQR